MHQARRLQKLTYSIQFNWAFHQRLIYDSQFAPFFLRILSVILLLAQNVPVITLHLIAKDWSVTEKKAHPLAGS